MRVTPASDVAPAMPRLGRERSIRRPLWLRSKATRFRPDTPRRRMVRARRRALFAIRRLERDLETLRSAPPPGLVSHQARQV